MNGKMKLTLIELIVSIVVLGILAAIVLISVNDLKREAIIATMKSNISIMQSSVLDYYVENEEYPIKGNSEISLYTPQEIDVEKLHKEGYLKKKLDKSKIKSQYYWVDIFGTVWGSTEDAQKDIAIFTAINDEKRLEFKLQGENSGFTVFRASKKGQGNISLEDYEEKELSAYNFDLLNTKLYNPPNVSIMEVESVDVEESEPIIQYNLKKADRASYLVSTKDQYGLESAPFGPDSGKPYFKPLVQKEGYFYFEISGPKKMFWIDFWTVQETPFDSKIEYKFSTQSEPNGPFGEEVEDFFSLDPAYGIRVHVYMTGSSNGVNPSLYDVDIQFDFEETASPPVTTKPPKAPTGEPTTPNLNPPTVGPYDKGSNAPTDGTVPNTGGSDSKPPIEESTCGENVKTSKSNNYLYYFYLEKGDSLSSLTFPNYSNSNIKVTSMEVRYSHKGDPYVVSNSAYSIPDESCVELEVVFEPTDKIFFPPVPPVPKVKENVSNPPKVIERGDPTDIIEKKKQPNEGQEPANPTEPAEPTEPVEDNPKNPPITPPELIEVQTSPFPPTPSDVIDEDWVTVDKLRFFGLGMKDTVKWTGWEKSDTTPENTRVVYKFSYHYGGAWTPEQPEFEERNAAKAVVVAYLQVKEEFAENPDQERPSVNFVKLFNDLDGTILPPMQSYPNEIENVVKQTSNSVGTHDLTKYPELSVLPPKNASDIQLKETQWRTIDKFRYYSVSADDSTVWIDWSKKDSQPENTRILYRFAYHKNGLWTSETDTFVETEAKHVVVIAYMQVKEELVGIPNSPEPNIQEVKLFRDNGKSYYPYFLNYKSEAVPDQATDISLQFGSSGTAPGNGHDTLRTTAYLPSKKWVAYVGSLQSTTGAYANSNRPAKGGDDVYIQTGYENGSMVASSASVYGFTLRLGGSGSDIPTSAAYDSAGNLYVAGYTGSSANGHVTPTSKGGMEAFIVKINSTGGIVWWKNYGGNGNDYFYDLSIMPNGRLVAVGSTKSTNGNFAGTTNYGSTDAFAMTIDTNGNIVATSRTGGAGADTSNKVAVDSNNNIFVLGESTSSNYTNDLTGDITLIKYNASLALAFSKTFGMDGRDWATDISVDGNNEVVAAGVVNCFNCSYNGKFGKGSQDIIFNKYSNSGELLWTRILGGTKNDYVMAIDTDLTGNIFFVGHSNSNDGDFAGENSYNRSIYGKLNPRGNDFAVKIEDRGLSSSLSNIVISKTSEKMQYAYVSGIQDASLGANRNQFLTLRYRMIYNQR